MIWVQVVLLAAIVAVAAGYLHAAKRELDKARLIAEDVQALADRQLTHEIEIRWLRLQLRPGSQRVRWPFPAHLTRVTPRPAQDPNQALWGANHLKENQP